MPSPNSFSRPTLRVGNFSAFLGDRADALEEVLEDDVDVLVGDYLAELTMLVLRKNEMRGGTGYAGRFIEHMAGSIERIAERKVKVIANAGGLDPEACAKALRTLCAERGVELTIAAVVGDNLRDDLGAVLGDTPVVTNLDTGQDLDLSNHEVLTANAYLGAWPIVEALNAGADIVVCPRMTDASLVVGPAAWKFGWTRDDWNQLAGAVVAGHLIECNSFVTGANFALFDEYEDLGMPGCPIAEIAEDGSSVITKTSHSDGIVVVDSVKAQLFYEVQSTRYYNPDVTVDLTSVQLKEIGHNRVQVSAVQGTIPTPTTKLSLTYEGGYRNTMTIGITGRKVQAKLAWLRRQVEQAVGKPAEFDAFRWTTVGPATETGGSLEESTALAVITARDTDRKKVGRKGFSDPIVALGIRSIPGFYLTTPPQAERLYGVQWPCLVPKEHIHVKVRIDGRDEITVPWGPAQVEPKVDVATARTSAELASQVGESTTLAPLGELVATRSGDKGGTANVGVWVRSEDAYQWLTTYLTPDRIHQLLPETRGQKVERYEFSNLLGLNFLIRGFLEDGVSSCTRLDAQAKGLGEYLSAQLAPIPTALLVGQHTV